MAHASFVYNLAVAIVKMHWGMIKSITSKEMSRSRQDYAYAIYFKRNKNESCYDYMIQW